MRADWITEPTLRDMAGPRAFERGEGYFASGAVVDLVDKGSALKARVMGTEEYAVRLWAEGGDLGYDCTCPVGDDGEFCKHGVAAGLAWLAGQRTSAPARRRRDDLAGIREWLAAAPRQRLEALLLEQAVNDPALRSRLDAQAARATATRGIDIKSLKETVGKALSVSGFVDYYGMRRFLERARPAADLIAGLIEDGHAEAARELAQHAIGRGIAACERTDDSGGGFGELLHDIAELHLKACRAAPPDPAAFGEQFFQLQMLDDWGLLPFEKYARFLRKEGLRTFRALAEKEWEKVPAHGPAERKARCSASYYRITSIMEALARSAGDVGALVAIKSRDLTLPYHFLEIAEILTEAGRRDDALDWAERGRKAFANDLDPRLVEFLAKEYARRGRHDEALALAWEEFTRRPALASYKHLKTCAGRAKAWEPWRAKALAWLREDLLKAQKRSHAHGSWASPRHSLLVEIFLWEGDSDAALAEAKAGGCTESLWSALARAREKNHPAEAAEIYRIRLDGIVAQKNNRAYEEAAALVKKTRDLMRRAKQEKEFAAWIDAVRAKHKAKRNFMQRLDKIMVAPSASR